MPVRTYDPKQVKVLIGGISMSGFADGTFINVSRMNDSFTKISGADGEVSRSKSNDTSGEMTLTLAQTSPSNDILSGFSNIDEQTGNGVVPVAIKDLRGLSTYISAFGWIRKPADGAFSKEIENREWSFDLADLKMFSGGNSKVE